MTWEIFERAASGYEQWYTTPQGRRADIAERAVARQLLQRLPSVRTILEVGSGTGHFSGWLSESGFSVVGLERAPEMLKQAPMLFPRTAFVLGEAERLPFRDGAFDAVVFITTLEFLETPGVGLREAVRTARHGLLAIVLNRCSIGGLSRRFGSAWSGALLRQARDYRLRRLHREVRVAAGVRLAEFTWVSTLFPDGLWRVKARVALGDILGVAASLREAGQPSD
ncbi:MAG: class I SAM-dependent methyltransferase [Candidatus Binataceae bacterium]